MSNPEFPNQNAVAASSEGDLGERQIAPFRPLVDFVKFHTEYISPEELPLDHDCPICCESPSESHERVIQIKLPNCHHVFGADCFERYIQRSHTCPMCRAMWFEERLAREASEIRIEINVADQATADEVLASWEENGSTLVQRIIEGRIPELSDTDDSTEESSSDHDQELVPVIGAEGVTSGLLLREVSHVLSVSSSDDEIPEPPRQRRRYN